MNGGPGRSERRVGRREWLLAAGLGLGAAAGAAIGRHPRAPAVLRPPGACDDFLAACIRCRQCVEACPIDALATAGADHGVGTGAPFFVARTDPCRLCAEVAAPPCAVACPTAALTPIADRRAIAIGTAELDESMCYAYNGVSCRACWHACPYPDEAIALDPATLRPTVVDERCVGCGLCEHACLTEPASIVVRPRP